MKPEDVAIMMMLATGFCSLMWARNASLRRKAEKRLWMVVTQYGLPAELLNDETTFLALPPQASPRMEQLEGQVDQIAQQLERLNESQDFLSRMLTERNPRLPEGRINTPH